MTEAAAQRTNWNFADVWDIVAQVHPDRLAVAQGELHRSWEEFQRRACNLSSALVAAGLGVGAKFAQYLYNGPEYLESIYAAFKARLVPVNTNYRYNDDEVAYLWENSDTEAVVFDEQFVDRCERLRRRLGVKEWIWVGPDPSRCPDWAVPYEELATRPGAEVRKPRSGDDLLLVYTGGTTGMPKGVMWRQDDLFSVLNQTARLRFPEPASPEEVASALAAPSKYPVPKLLPGPPLMHGTGLFTAMSVLASGGAVVMPSSRRFDPRQTLELIGMEQVTEMSIVGDAFARPLLEVLDSEPGRYDISSLWLIISSGVIWSAEVKQGLLRHNPKLVLVDTLGSSEAIGVARSTSRAGRAAPTAGFEAGPDTTVITEDGQRVEPGSGQRGLLALRGRGPVGYYKDPDKTARTFAVIDGVRYAIPGDWATIAADGTVILLGRGSVCINTGGEKVFPEEVEEALKRHPSVADAAVVGLPDDRYGEQVTAVLVRGAGQPEPSDAELLEFVAARLARYKAPRRVVWVDTLGRSPSGKLDYKALRELAAERLGVSFRA